MIGQQKLSCSSVYGQVELYSRPLGWYEVFKYRLRVFSGEWFTVEVFMEQQTSSLNLQAFRSTERVLLRQC